MKRGLGLVLAVLAVLALAVPQAFAQAPAAPTTKVTITGFVDNISSYTRNLSIADLTMSQNRDSEWYARTRVRPDITAELGSTKFVLGLEMDAAWGQTGASDNTAQARSGATGGWDINTDTTSMIEVKWAYTEFDMPGLPFKTRVRLGAQPFATTYKGSVLASGDFAGVHLTSTFSPMFKLNWTWAQAEEMSTGIQDNFARGEDWASILSVEVEPFKGLQLRPLVSLFHASGITSGSARQARGGLGTGATGQAVGVGTGFANPYNGGSQEDRWTVGLDARFSSGPFYFDPTIFYQWGNREIYDYFVGGRGNQERRAWLFDFRGGFQTGPLNIEAAAIYTPGNAANSDIRNHRTVVRYYEPIDTDTSYYGGWAEQWALGIDYFNILRSGAGGLNPGNAIGYDKYGLIRLGAKAAYAVTPAFSLRTAVIANWTDEKVDTDGTLVNTTGITPSNTPGDGGSRYLGTEVDLGFVWKFAPGVAFDLVGSYGFTGSAMETATSQNGNTAIVKRDKNAQDSQAVTARLRYTW